MLEIEVRREWLRLLVAILALLFLGSLGYAMSPRTEDGRPMLLLPDTRAVELYRRQALSWAQDWRVLEVSLRSLLETRDGILLSQINVAQDDFERAVLVARSVESTDAPPTLLGLHDLATRTAEAHVSASMAVNRWLAIPSNENYTAALQLCEQASSLLGSIESNQWIGVDSRTANGRP